MVFLGKDGEWIEGAEVNCKLFSKWFKERKGLIIKPETIYQLWSFHSNDWDAKYLFMYNTDEGFRRQAKNIFRVLDK